MGDDPLTVFVGGLPHTADASALQSYFAQYGEIRSAEVNCSAYFLASWISARLAP